MYQEGRGLIGLNMLKGNSAPGPGLLQIKKPKVPRLVAKATPFKTFGYTQPAQGRLRLLGSAHWTACVSL